jgi:uncharacterized protein DUF2817
MDSVRHFSQSYAEARAKFIEAAREHDLAVDRHVLPDCLGVGGETLAMDVALLGASDAKGLLLLTSAMHGIEGYGGSGAQIGLLRDERFVRAVRDAGIAVLYVHAVNPHGFSHGRRVNENNVDLNRNFRMFALPAPVNAAYAEVHGLLLPATWPPRADNQARIAEWIAVRGERAFQEAVSGGQYEFPDGLFYGGAEPTWSNQTLRAVLRRYASTCDRMAWIDFHTGLGPRGHGEKIWNGPDDALAIERARTWWGADVTSIYDGTSSSARLVGICGNAAHEECPDVAYAGIALEFGTVPMSELFLALRADHWLHNQAGAPPTNGPAIRRQMRDAFYVDAADWKEQVYAQARDAALMAVEHLGETPP